jgi:hypothetical protein
MGRFDLKTETIHADWWDEGETVTITQLTWAQKQDLQKYAMRDIVMPNSKREARNRQIKYTDADWKSLAVQTMLAAIVAWTFTQNGSVMSVNQEAVEKLSEEDGDFIMEAVDALNPERDDEFQGGSGNSLRKR